MSELGKKQKLFVRMLASLIIYAVDHGYELTVGDAYRDPRATFPYSHKNSLHYSRLAIDLNVFRNGRYLKEAEDYIDLGEYWESLGGSWGGKFRDANHFSLEYKGMK